jgi:hypothetical protein
VFGGSAPHEKEKGRTTKPKQEARNECSEANVEWSDQLPSSERIVVICKCDARWGFRACRLLRGKMDANVVCRV